MLVYCYILFVDKCVVNIISVSIFLYSKKKIIICKINMNGKPNVGGGHVVINIKFHFLRNRFQYFEPFIVTRNSVCILAVSVQQFTIIFDDIVDYFFGQFGKQFFVHILRLFTNNRLYFNFSPLDLPWVPCPFCFSNLPERPRECYPYLLLPDWHAS